METSTTFLRRILQSCLTALSFRDSAKKPRKVASPAVSKSEPYIEPISYPSQKKEREIVSDIIYGQDSLQVVGKESLRKILTGAELVINPLDRKAYVGAERNNHIPYEIAEAWIKYGIVELTDLEDYIGVQRYKSTIRLSVEVVAITS